MLNDDYRRVAERAAYAAENTSQVPNRAIVHALWIEGSPDKTMCGKLESLDVEYLPKNRIVSCPDCLAALKRERQRRSHEATARKQKRRYELQDAAEERTEEPFDVALQLGQADPELVTIMRQRAQIAIDFGNRDLAKALLVAADVLHVHATGEQISHNTSVPEAGDDDLTPPKHEGFNCALCHDSGRRFGKICECKQTIDGIPHYTPYD